MRIKSLIGPFQLIALMLWLVYIITSKAIPDFQNNWFMSLTMLFGSIIAGATSEGGGAVAFPVMTLVFKIKPHIARDFSLLIQSFGMTAASFVILKNRIPIAKKFLLICLPASFLGQATSFSYLMNLFSPVTLKITFTSIWLSYGLVLYFHRIGKEHSLEKEISKNETFLIFIFAFIGGIITSLTGSGVDILTFSLATLYFGIPVSVATPTSVVLMAMNSVVGSLLKESFFGGIEKQAIDYWLVCLPVVIFGAPFGAMFIKDRTTKFIIYFLQASIVIQFIFSWVILPLSFAQKLGSIIIVITGALAYYLLYKISLKTKNR